MKLRRGFKTEANAYSREFRQELGLLAEDPLCPFKLAQHLGVRATPLEQFANDEPEAYRYLQSKQGRKEFSAITLCFGMERLIIYNDAHSRPRTTSNVAHELSHIILMHPAKPPFDKNGSRHYDAKLEEEANWLGPALLISEEAALKIGRERKSHSIAASEYGVSTEVLRMRLNVLGIQKRLSYSKV
jgi:hypothetical protein